MEPARRTFFRSAFRVVDRIPRGRVATYGQVARMAGRPGAARQVGWALHALPSGSHTPWHRVLNAEGRISPRGLGQEEEIQRRLLEGEGVPFDARGRVDLERFGWDGRPRDGTRGGSRRRMS